VAAKRSDNLMNGFQFHLFKLAFDQSINSKLLVLVKPSEGFGKFDEFC